MTPEQHDQRQAMITATFVALTAFAVLCVLLSAVGAAEYSVTVEPSAYVVTVETAKPPAKSTSVVNLYSATWCAPCQAAKAELKAAAKDLPFTVRIVDVSNGGQPGYVKSLPWVSWPKAEGEVWQRSYPGVKELVSEWQNTQSKASHTSVSSAGRAGTSIKMAIRATHHWTYPGEIRSHLQQSHGITAAEAAMLTREQAESIHDAIHEGTSVTRIRTWARSRGYIK